MAILMFEVCALQALTLGSCSLAGIQALTELTALTQLKLYHSLMAHELASLEGPLGILLGRLAHLKDLCLTWHWSHETRPAVTSAIPMLPNGISLSSQLTRLTLGAQAELEQLG